MASRQVYSRPTQNDADFLTQIGERVRAARSTCGFTRKELALASGASERYLAQIEAGSGNMSVLVLKQIAEATSLPIESFFPGAGCDTDKRYRFAFIGLRGAGKSTLAKVMADEFGLPFIELTRMIEQESGLAIPEIFSLYGESGYRELEKRCLQAVIADYDQVVLAVAGGITGDDDTFQLLLENFNTIWLRASPEEHMQRVLEQGDRRPVAGFPKAMDALRLILTSREKSYARADYQLNTSGQPVEDSGRALSNILQPLMPGQMSFASTRTKD